MKTFLYFLWIVLFIPNCKTDNETSQTKYKTENVIIILIDGARYSETWGDSTHQYISGQDALSKEGVVLTEFYNDGVTNTMNGHNAITTGVYENLENTGTQVPTNPSLFQLYLEKKKYVASDAWIISSKDKLHALGDCEQIAYKGKYNPRTDCGISGLFTGTREDSTTYADAVNILNELHPHFAFISFKQPDIAAHMNDWYGYFAGIKQSDDYAYKIWQLIQSDPRYKDKTTVFITNDHGRHLDGVADGFVSHGDTCAGCRHIMLLAAGPDFKKDVVINSRYDLTDINATIAQLFGLKTQGEGEVIHELFE